jgi:hypothetical protein
MNMINLIILSKDECGSTVHKRTAGRYDIIVHETEDGLYELRESCVAPPKPQLTAEELMVVVSKALEMLKE